MKRWIVIVTLGIFLVALSLEYKRLTIKPWPPTPFVDPVMHFKYGSIGAETLGYPYRVWRELPTLFKDRIPNGFSDFGFIQEEGRPLPIGISVRRTGVMRVGFNCATCHSATVAIDGKRLVVLGAPAGRLDLQAYLRFTAEATLDSRFSADRVFRSAEQNGRPFSALDRIIYRVLVFPELQRQMEATRDAFAWMNKRAPHGPGRTDALNVWRSRWGLHPDGDEAVGTVDFPAVWDQSRRQSGAFHWDGNNTSLEERNISAALAGGAPEWLLERQSIQRVSEWLMQLKAPAFPAHVDPGLAARGRELFESERCSGCHAGPALGQVTRTAEVRTDPERESLFSGEMVERFNQVGSLYSWKFSHYRDTDGYANLPLDGVWMRAPYLHNGSVPTLRALLSRSDERPRRFVTGCDAYDVADMGYQCSEGFIVETSLRGNSNSGHEYGTNLSQADKDALLEYLKTL